MPKKQRRRRPAPRMHRPRPPQEREPHLLDEVADVLRGPNPLELLHFASSLLTVVDPRGRQPFGEDDESATLTLGGLAASLIDVRVPEATALLGALAAMAGDDLVVRRIRRELAGRADELPPWLRDLEPLTIESAVQMSHVLGDGDNILIGARTAAGQHFTVVAYVDHNLGTIVKDAFVLHQPLDDTVATFRATAGGDPDVVFTALDLADARVRVAEAIEKGARTYPPYETDSWPRARPLVEWVLRCLPAGGRDYERPEWSDEDREALADRFFASEHARGLGEDDRELLEALVWFGCDYGPGDPLRWSRVAVELLLDDWLPRKIVADVAFLARAPELLRRFVRFSHAERGIRAVLTDETLAAVDEWEPEYQRTIRSPRPQGPMALLAAMGAMSEEQATEATLLEILRRAVGGDDALRTLGTEPLPDEPLDLDGLSDDIRPKVAEAAALADACCAELLDVEYRTACRRLLRDVSAADPEVFRRRGRAVTAAAAVVWIVLKVNHGFRQRRGGLTAKSVGEWFGLADPAARAPTLLRALGVEGLRYDPVLGTPRYLVADRRRGIVESRDRLIA